MTRRDNALEVWLDDDLGPACLVGTLAHDRGQIRFHYERDWLKDPRAFALVEDAAAGRLHEHLCRAHILVRKFDYEPTWLRFGLAPDAAGDRRLAEALKHFR